MQRNTPSLARDDGEVEARREVNGALVPSPEAPRQARDTRAQPLPISKGPARRTRRGTPWFAWMLGGCLSALVALVLLCAALVGTVGGLAFRFASTQSASETKNQGWTVTGAPALRVESDAADIRVQTGGDGAVHLTTALSAHAASESDAKAALQKVAMTASQIGDSVSISAQTAQAASLGVSLNVTLTVTVPRETSLVIVLQSGNAVVDGVSGSISTSVHDGDATLNGVAFTAASLVDVQNGNATVSGTLRNGASLDLQVASGNATVTLPKMAPVTVDAVTAAGNVTISGWAAAPGRSGAGSSVHVDTVTSRAPLTPAGALSIHVKSGDIALKFT